MRPRSHLPQVRHHQRLRARIRERLNTEDELIADAERRGWAREVERHQSTKRRLLQLLDDLDESLQGPAGVCRGEDSA